MSGRVVSIFIAPEAGKPMRELESIKAIAQSGLEGDRYALGIGVYSRSKRKTVRQVSLISIEAIKEANSTLSTPFLPNETRRNIVTAGVDLNGLVGKEFAVGGVRMKGIELCDPCKRPSKLVQKPDFEKAFELRGGLRAEVLNDGLIQVNDPIIVK